MAKSNEEVAAMVQKATATIPANPEITARIATEAAQPLPPANNPVPEATPVEQGLDPDVANLFGNLAADMDQEVSGVPAPEARPVTPPAVLAPVTELPYEPPVHQRVPGQGPDSLAPQPAEPQQLEAAIEQPLVEEEIRMTAEQWATQQRTLAPPPEPAPPAEPQLDATQLRAAAVKNLTETEYALSTEDATALIAEPDKVLPGLAARMHVNMQVGLAQQIAQMLPGIVQAQIQQMGKVQSLESSFFGQYPELNKPEFRATVQESLGMIRQVNPQATREEVMRDGAALAAVRLRTKLGSTDPATVPALPPMGPPVPIANAPLSPPNPAQPAPVPTQDTFTPAQGGGGTGPVVPTDPNAGNIFASLAEDPEW